VWLLRAPRPLREVASRLYLDRQSGFDHQSPLSLLAGPERIESGWWDGGDVMRDYFLARSADQALLWIYRSRSIDAHWFLHGVFA
jgi:protein ImuB